MSTGLTHTTPIFPNFTQLFPGCIASRTTSDVEVCLEEISEEVIVLSDANDECRLCYAER